MKALPTHFRLRATDRRILEMLKEGIEPKKVSRKVRIPYPLVKKKIEKLQRLGLV